MSRCGEAPPETAEPASIAGPATVTAPDDEAAAWLLELADQAPPVSPPPEPVPALPQIDHEIDLLFNEMDELEMIGGIDFEFPEFQDRPAPVAHYAALIEEAKVQAARRPDLFDGTSGDDQTDSPLAGLPLDVLCALGGYVDISTAATLWQTCKKLWTVGEWTTARTEFLVGQFGLDQAVEGCVHYLRLLTPFVVRAVFGRVKKLKGKIPR